jgi:hypothetical protein
MQGAMRHRSQTCYAALGLLPLVSIAGCTGLIDTDEAPLTIESPTNGAFVASHFVGVTGTATTPYVTVLGERVDVVGGVFETGVELGDGPATIEVQAGDASASVDITVDAAAPVIVITAPAPATFVPGDELVVEGRVTGDPSIDHVEIDGETVPVDEAGLFTLARTVAPGAHRVRVVAQDQAGNVGYAWRSVITGELAPTSSPLLRGAYLRLGEIALDEIAEGLEPLLDEASIESRVLAADHLASGFWGHLDATGYGHGSPPSISPPISRGP